MQSPLVGVARDTPSPERNKTGRGPGAPSRRFRERSRPPAPRSQLPGECAPGPRVPGPSVRPPARRGNPAAPARLPPPPGTAGALRGAGRKSGAARRPSRAAGVGQAAALSRSGAPGSGRPGTKGSCVRLTRGGPAPPPPAGLAAEQSAILRATDAHCTQGDEGIRATPLPHPPAPGGECARGWGGGNIWLQGPAWGLCVMSAGVSFHSSSRTRRNNISPAPTHKSWC